MPSFSRRDLNRQKKIYPYYRSAPMPQEQQKTLARDDYKFPFEAANINTLSNVSSVTYSFTEQFNDPPVVVALFEPSDNESAVVLSIEDVTNTSVRIVGSGPFTGNLMLHVLLLDLPETLRDPNRFRWIYPFTTKPSRMSNVTTLFNTDQAKQVLGGVEEVVDGMIITVTFPTTMVSRPTVTIIPSNVDYNVLLTLRSVTENGFEVHSTVPFNGYIHWHAMAEYPERIARWEAVDPLRDRKSFVGTQVLADGRLMTYGGTSGPDSSMTAPDQDYATCDIYDYAGNRTATGDLTLVRFAAAATLLGDDRVLVAGGKYAWPSHTLLSGSETWDPATDTWTAQQSLPANVAYHSLVSTSDGDAILVGGTDLPGPDNNFNAVDVVRRFDYGSNTWSTLASMNQPRWGHFCLWLDDGRLFVGGGAVQASGIDPLSSCEIYDVDLDTWTTVSSMNTPRAHMGAAKLNDGKIIIVGGENLTGPLSSVEIYDPMAGSWTYVASCNHAHSWYPKHEYGIHVLDNGDVVVLGGSSDANGTSTSIVETYDVYKNTWMLEKKMPYANAYFSSAYFGARRVIVAGGWGDVGDGDDDHYLSGSFMSS